MGLYDSIEVLDRSVVCAEGHPLKVLQTKDMECAMAHFYLKESVLYRALSERSQGFSRLVDGVLRETILKTDAPHPYTGDLHIYDFCDECRPVCFINEYAWSGIIDTKQPWCEFRMTFAQGCLTTTRVMKNQTRAEVVEELKAMARTVLEDDNPLVIKHLEKMRDQHTRWR